MERKRFDLDKLKKIIGRFPKLYLFLSSISGMIDYRHNRRMIYKQSIQDFVVWQYRRYFKKKLDLSNPQSFNEKMMWLKAYWFDENAIICSDKNSVRSFVEDKGYGHILIKQIALFDSPSEIDLSKLPDRFVLKPTHDSGHVIFCNEKSAFDIKKAQRRLKKWLKIDYEYMGGEWVYHSNSKKIVCEEFLEDKEAGELFDYKFFCFNGEPELVFFVSDRAKHAKSDFYDLNWNLMDFRWIYEPSGKLHPKPKLLDEMIHIARVLSKGFPFVRVDLYEVSGRIYFGEMTFFHGGGCGWFKPDSIDYDLGRKIELPKPGTPWGKIISCKADSR